MALTATQQTELIQYCVGIFNAAPGGYMRDLASMVVEDGMTTQEVALAFADSDLFKGLSQSYDIGATNEQFANVYVNSLLGAATTQSYIDLFETLLDNGMARNVAVVASIDYVASLDAADPARAYLDARTTVSSDYTFDQNGDSTDFAFLQSLLSGVQPAGANLTVDRDIMVGNAYDNDFYAGIIDNANTLQNGDMLTGGAGSDALYADIGGSSLFAIAPVTDSIETFSARAQSLNVDFSDNNISGTQNTQAMAKIDAENMSGVIRYEDIDSRADLIIEDVNILPNQITSDVTIAMTSTDPGNVDFAVYFDQHSLVAAGDDTIGGKEVFLKIMDVQGADATADPLSDLPLSGVEFAMNDGSTVRVAGASTPGDPDSDAITAATSYAELVDALNAALVTQGLENDFVFELTGVNFTSDVTIDSVLYSGIGEQIGARYIGSDLAKGFTTGSSFLFFTYADSDEGRVAEISNSTGSTVENVITSTIELDDVGRGSMGGDLVVGGMSTGETSDSLGVEKFDITVFRDSELQTINSTNNSLEIVELQNDGMYNGDLTVTGVVPNWDMPLPGAENEIMDRYGFTDVRVIDATAMVGDVTATAVLSNETIPKYIDLFDDAFDPAADDVEFLYLFGQGDDFFDIDISASNFTNNWGTTSSGDFDLLIDGGAGDDFIEFRITASADETTPWYVNSSLMANLAINGGVGDDTILTPGAGNVIIDAGANNDAVYVNNSGGKAAFVFNTTDNLTATPGNGVNDLTSDTVDSYLVGEVAGVYQMPQIQVDFMGFIATVDVIETSGATASVNDLQINQAIKAAINNDEVLSDLLEAYDGPANSLVVQSKIDGVLTDTDLVILYSDGVAPFAPLNADYDTVVAYYGGISFNTSDNTIDLGAGLDVAVLGTEATSNDTLVFNGYNNGVNSVVNFDATPVAAAIPGVQEVFTATFTDDTTIDTFSGTLWFDGLGVGIIDGQTGATTASIYEIASGVMPNWNAVDNLDGSATFTAVAAGDVTDVTGANFLQLDAWSDVTASVVIDTPGVDAVAASTGGDLIDLTSYDADFVQDSVIPGAADLAGTYIVWTEAAGAYTFNEYTVADGAVSAASLIGVIDFGDSVTGDITDVIVS